ncbi:uncharacterized protein LOC126883074 [Diabrotica virgifera virgifera]|uniref:C3H1-type domain-containing protein n=1 Tax=Diabrotica virgifera virgifera TaxID=50390 RepID=A0ABM5K239_DIAVI|nr:uncharacterized protein LOC126883074 [Diabrotica virgifera virgifera]
MSLVPDYGDSSNSDDSSSSTSDSENEIIPTKKSDVASKNKLPAPSFGGSNLTEESTKSSVFKNPFIEAENAKDAILQKHVKMVESKDNMVIINGKKICWNYRKGRCRFGHNCKYAHDSDVQKTQEQIEVEKVAAIKNSVVCENSQTSMHLKHTKVDEEVSDEDDDTKKGKQKRKRPGLTQGLVPGKKVMKQYMHQKT